MRFAVVMSAIVFMAAFLPACGKTEKKSADQTAAINKALELQNEKIRIARCQTNVSDTVEKATALAKAGDVTGADGLLRDCGDLLTDPGAKALASKYQKVADAQAAKAVAALKAQKKKEGASIGMSRDEVLASSWGKPQSINTTTTANGTREQWVYGGRNYLYFRNGILTTIQN